MRLVGGSGEGSNKKVLEKMDVMAGAGWAVGWSIVGGVGKINKRIS